MYPSNDHFVGDVKSFPEEHSLTALLQSLTTLDHLTSLFFA
jgi:hypothetical protein